ncbi:hypothetical protein MUNTM_39870 [Mycobacterium sp. MUNTM1]
MAIASSDASVIAAVRSARLAEQVRTTTTVAAAALTTPTRHPARREDVWGWVADIVVPIAVGGCEIRPWAYRPPPAAAMSKMGLPWLDTARLSSRRVNCKAHGENKFAVKSDIREPAASRCVTMTEPTGPTTPDKDPTWSTPSVPVPAPLS